jgi:O-acetyl-ADP-ribose deacetylase (regulator of RNase III)
MRESTGDLWAYPADAICVPTCGVVKANGELVMGAGVAREAARRYPALPAYYGRAVREAGNAPVAHFGLRTVVSFPTKHHWNQPAVLPLIEQSARIIVTLADAYGWRNMVLPRVGCGFGGLEWSDVRPVLSAILGERFVVVRLPGR